MTAKIIPLFPQNCHDCIHGYHGRDGVLCEITGQIVFDERSATSCECYEEDK